MEPLDHYAERWARELHARGVPASEAIDMMVRESKEDARELRDELIRAGFRDGIYPDQIPTTPIPRWMAQSAVEFVYGER